MQDAIKRQIEIEASMEKIYQAISNPDLVVKWFPETLEGEYEVGKQPIFGFGDHGRNQVYIVEARPNDYFAYRWVPGANHFLGDVLTVANTLVEFSIEEISNQKCLVTLAESGFASLPKEILESSYQQNSKGWDFMLGRLVEFVER